MQPSFICCSPSPCFIIILGIHLYLTYTTCNILCILLIISTHQNVRKRIFACFVHPKIVGKKSRKEWMDRNVFCWKSDQSLLELLILIQSGSHLWTKTLSFLDHWVIIHMKIYNISCGFWLWGLEIFFYHWANKKQSSVMQWQLMSYI